MLDAALEIQQYIQSAKREDLSYDRKLVHSLVHLFEIIGEAATQVSDELKEEYSEIPWFIITRYEEPAHSRLLYYRPKCRLEHLNDRYSAAYNRT
jgi:hypothetical protein